MYVHILWQPSLQLNPPTTEPLQVQDCHDIPEPPLQVEQWLPQWIAH